MIKSENKVDILEKVLLQVAVGFTLIQWLLILIFNIDGLDLEVSSRLSQFFILQPIWVQYIIKIVAVSFNCFIFASIATKVTLKILFKKTFYLFVMVIPFVLIGGNFQFYGIVIVSMIFSTIVVLRGISDTKICVAIGKTFGLIVLSAMFQFIVMFIRFRYLLSTDGILSFYQELILSRDLYIIIYLFYRYLRRRDFICVFFGGQTLKRFIRKLKRNV
jgi:hypothetical protein